MPSERRLITSETSSSESHDLYSGLVFQLLSGGGGDGTEGVWPLASPAADGGMIGAVILTSLMELLVGEPPLLEDRRLNCSTIDITLLLLPAVKQGIAVVNTSINII